MTLSEQVFPAFLEGMPIPVNFLAGLGKELSFLGDPVLRLRLSPKSRPDYRTLLVSRL